MTGIPAVIDHAKQTVYSDPGAHAVLIPKLKVGADGSLDSAIRTISTIVNNVIVHYRGSGHKLPAETTSDIHARWLSDILSLDQSRHPIPLAVPRKPVERVQGCCRDHTLFAVGVLRANGIVARSRIGFVDYFHPTWHHDHVIVEIWDTARGRWRRFDPELPDPIPRLSTPNDIPRGEKFYTAAEVWQGVRAGKLDADTFGVDINVNAEATRGKGFVRGYVILEVAHRFGDELLLWDIWGGREDIRDDSELDEYVDEIAALLVAADAGDLEAERELVKKYMEDDRLRPGTMMTQWDPLTDQPSTVALRV